MTCGVRLSRWPTQAIVLGTALLLLLPRVAAAHLGLSSSTPANGAQLAAAPRDFRLTFTEAVERTVARVRLVGPNGAEIRISALRQPSDSAQVMLADILGPLEPGAYTIEWQVIGADGHPVRGTVAFVIAAGATGLAEPAPAEHHDAEVMPTGAGFGADSLGYVVVRWLQFTALLIAIGVVTFRFAVLRFLGRTEEDSTVLTSMRDGAAVVGLWAATALVVTVLLRLYAQALAMHGPQEAFNMGFIGTMLMSTMWGWAWFLQAVAAIVAVIAFGMARRGRSTGWRLALLACLALAVTPALSGHAVATPDLSGLAVAADTLHVIGSAGWLGSLLLVLAVGVPVAMRLGEGRRGPAVARLVNAFSPTALFFAGLAAVTGVFAGWLHIGFSSALWESDYGRTLLIKLAILSVALGTGAYNWLRVKPRLGDDVGTRRIRRSALVELAVAVLVVLVTAVLVATPPPMDMDMEVGMSVQPGLSATAEAP